MRRGVGCGQATGDNVSCCILRAHTVIAPLSNFADTRKPPRARSCRASPVISVCPIWLCDVDGLTACRGLILWGFLGRRGYPSPMTMTFRGAALVLVLGLCVPVQAQTPEIDALRARAEAGGAEA